MDKTMAHNFSVSVLIRVNKKSGKIDKVMTGMGTALMKMQALNNTPKSKVTYIFERKTGKMLFACLGTESFPKIVKDEKLGTCEDLGISLEDLQEMGEDDRFGEDE